MLCCILLNKTSIAQVVLHCWVPAAQNAVGHATCMYIPMHASIYRSGSTFPFVAKPCISSLPFRCQGKPSIVQRRLSACNGLTLEAFNLRSEASSGISFDYAQRQKLPYPQMCLKLKTSYARLAYIENGQEIYSNLASTSLRR